MHECEVMAKASTYHGRSNVIKAPSAQGERVKTERHPAFSPRVNRLEISTKLTTDVRQRTRTIQILKTPEQIGDMIFRGAHVTACVSAFYKCDALVPHDDLDKKGQWWCENYGEDVRHHTEKGAPKRRFECMKGRGR
jgi:hypothetical protein